MTYRWSLYSTGDDLAKLYQCLLNKGTLNGKRIIGEKTLADMVSIHTGDEKSGYTDNMTWGFGFSIIRESKGVAEKLSPGSFGHGGAYGTQGWIDPTKGLYTILLIQRVNLTEGDAIRKTLHDASVSLLATSRPSIEARFLAGPAKLPQRPTRQLVEFR